MGLMEKIAENRIREAQDEGLFNNLPGHGKPLNLEEESGVPEDMRLAFKILKNAGCLPIEMELSRQAYNLRQLLRAAIDEKTRKELRRELNFLLLKEAISRKR
jgi:DnaJ homologue, subfamily C, member 28, conserved domain